MAKVQRYKNIEECRKAVEKLTLGCRNCCNPEEHAKEKDMILRRALLENLRCGGFPLHGWELFAK